VWKHRAPHHMDPRARAEPGGHATDPSAGVSTAGKSAHNGLGCLRIRESWFTFGGLRLEPWRGNGRCNRTGRLLLGLGISARAQEGNAWCNCTGRSWCLARVSRPRSALQKRDAASLTSAADHAVENRWSTAAASADFPCARNAAARPNSDHPFSGNRFRSSR
jgi:hypothetical protein